MKDVLIESHIRKKWTTLSMVLVYVVLYVVGNAIYCPMAKAKTGEDSDWSSQPVERPDVPAVNDPAWSENPIDAFIYDRLQQAGLQPNGMASKQALVRRASYDLLGLAPTSEVMDAFLADESKQAWDQVLDKLLVAPQYGEKWGRHWLDLVRYAETNGYERDSKKPFMWRYRDYVIDAFNSDKPYDAFLTEQLAGDELQPATPDSLTATGFYRLMIWDDEPVDRLQQRYDVLDDIVSTASQVMLGMSLGCARCHDHKKDPISQKDYYSFMAFFHNLTDMSVGGIVRDVMNESERAEHEQKVADKKLQQDRLLQNVHDMEKRYLAQQSELQAPEQAGVRDLSDLRYRFYRDTWEELPEFDQLKAETQGTLEGGLIHLGPATRGEAFGFVFEATLLVPSEGDYTFYLDSDDGSRLTIDEKVVVAYDGTHGLGDRRSATVRLPRGSTALRLDYFQGGGGKGLELAWSGPNLSQRRLTRDEESMASVRDQILKEGQKVFSGQEVEAYQTLLQELDRVENQSIPRKVAPAAREKGPVAPDSYILVRGSAHAQGDPVEPAYPAMLHPPTPEIPDAEAEAESSGRRRVLARWIASTANPRTARVMVNRIWQHHFGRGIVPTSNEFGFLGEGPTHPQLLDWLAAEFMDSGWSVKQMHRLIMRSRTYRMSSKGWPAALAADPENDLFWRMDMRRLTAEEIRDTLLQVSGDLNLQMYGPPVYPEMPAEVLATASRPDDAWGQSPLDQAHRRSIYIHVKRSLLTPLLTSFDMADTDFSCPVRFATTVPTQSLTMLNSKFLNDQAARFADRLRKEMPNDLQQQIQRAFRLALSRPPAEGEIEQGRRFMTEMEQDFGLTADQALNRFCLLMLNLNEFIFID